LILCMCVMLFTACGSNKHTSKKKKKKKAKTSQIAKKQASQPVKPKQTQGSDQGSKNTNAKAEKVIQTAKSYMGTPYKFGGTSKSGMDCSGLVLTAYRSVGLELPRSSKEQSTMGKAVEKKDLLPGDMVFFSRSFNKEVSHAGIVVESTPSSARFIHASTSKGVRIDDLYGEYWSKLFLKARRVL